MNNANNNCDCDACNSDAAARAEAITGKPYDCSYTAPVKTVAVDADDFAFDIASIVDVAAFFAA